MKRSFLFQELRVKLEASLWENIFLAASSKNSWPSLIAMFCLWSAALPQDTHMGDLTRQCCGQMDSRHGGAGAKPQGEGNGESSHYPKGLPLAEGEIPSPAAKSQSGPWGNIAMGAVKVWGQGAAQGKCWAALPLRSTYSTPRLCSSPALLLPFKLSVLVLVSLQVQSRWKQPVEGMS